MLVQELRAGDRGVDAAQQHRQAGFRSTRRASSAASGKSMVMVEIIRAS